VADGSASAAAAAAKEVEYQAGVQKLVDLLSKLNPAAKEFVPSSAAAASPPKKALSADAPVFDYHSIGAGNGGAKDSATDASFYIGSPQRRRWNGYINQGRSLALLCLPTDPCFSMVLKLPRSHAANPLLV